MLIILLAIQGLASTGPSGLGDLVQREAWVMGTRLRVVAEGPDAGRAAEIAISEVERMDRLLSSWSPSSDLAVVNAASLSPQVTAQDTWRR